MKTSKYKIKVVVGFRKDQEFTLDANEAHRAYYLFLNPDKRGTFANGLALKGSDIQRIEPDYHATKCYNHDYRLTGEDMRELAADGTVTKLNSIMVAAKEVAQRGIAEDMHTPLHTLVTEKYPELSAGREGSKFSQKVLAGKSE